MSKQQSPPPPVPLPNLVDNYLTAAQTIAALTRRLVAWHARYDVAGGHLCDGSITTAEQLSLDALLVDLRRADTIYRSAHAAFVDARAAAKVRPPR